MVERLSGLIGRRQAMPRDSGNRTAVATLRQLQSSKDALDTEAIDSYVRANPDSRWSPALRFEMARRMFRAGWFAQAMARWDELWDELKDARDAGSVQIADEVLGRLLEANVGFSKADRLAKLIGEEEARPGNPVLEAKILRAKQVVWLLRHRGAQNVMCGPVALYEIMKANRQTFVPIPLSAVTDDYIATGISLAEIQNYADHYGLGLVPARKSAGHRIPTPAIMHSSTGHYSTLLSESEGRYFLVDRALRFQGWVSLAAIESQSSGNFLIPRESLTSPWQAIAEPDAKLIFGRDGIHGHEPLAELITSCSVRVGGNSQRCPMATYTFHPQVAGIRVEDWPVGYTPPVGPSPAALLAYNDLDDSRTATAPQFANVGRMWSLSWVSFVDPALGTLRDSSVVSVYLAGGGVEVSDYSTATGMFGPHDRSFATVVRTGTATFTRTLPDGSREIYDSPDRPLVPNRVFLTRIIDPSGNALTFTYDANMRLVSVTDAIGQVTTLAYGLPSDMWKVTRITDPFGRSASFTYNSTGDLASITDVIGLTSSFAYDARGAMTSFTTPYGTTTFQKVTGTNSWDRTVTATDPQGDQERVQYLEPIDVPGSEPALPTTFSVGGTNVTFIAETGRLQLRNSFYWSKKAMKDAPGDVSAAKNFRWFTNDRYLVSPILESTKEALEGRVWFNYPGMGEDSRLVLHYPKLGGIPTKSLRVLEDGTPQLNQMTYNRLGRPTSVTDPLGRSTTFAYASNDIDLLEVRQRTGAGSSERLALLTYNAQHLPLTFTDAAGQTTTYTYNSRGQPLTMTNAVGEATTFAYDAHGYLTSIDGPLAGSGDAASFTYDSNGRVRTFTEPDTYALTFDYDALDRTTKITYPDATYEEFTYTRLDLTGSRDRLGRQSTAAYNSLRQTVQTQDPLNRVTRYEWCRCGDLKSVIDPLGRITSWLHDVQGRVTGRQYADGSKVTYVHGHNTSRLKQRVDEKGQITSYEYNVDDTVRQIAYPNAAVATPNVSFTYDGNYNRVLTMADGAGTTAYAYHPVGTSPGSGAGRLASIDGPLPNDTIAFQYDPLGRTVSRAINGVASTATFDPLGRTATIANPLGTFTYAHDGAMRRLVSVGYPNGVSTSFSYLNETGDRRLQQISHSRGSTAISQFGYAYNAIGNIVGWSQQADSGSSATHTLAYDAADQLTSAVVTQGATTLKTYSYSYDPAGNRSREQIDGTTRQFSYNPLNELSAASNSHPTAAYEWDGSQRMTAIVQGGNRTEFTYDGFGRRVRIVEKQAGTVVSDKRFVWCDYDLCEERDAGGSGVTKRYFPQGAQVGTQALFYSKDHLGSIRELTDSTGQIVARYDYDPYGRRTKATGSFDSDFGFTGFYHHAPSNLNLAPFRAYDADTGRWMSRDPVLQETSGGNLFVYADGDPINRIDPLGDAWIFVLRDHPGVYRGLHDLYVISDPDRGGFRFYDYVPVNPGGVDARFNFVPGKFQYLGTSYTCTVPDIVLSKKVPAETARRSIAALERAVHSPVQPNFNVLIENCRARPSEVINAGFHYNPIEGLVGYFFPQTGFTGYGLQSWLQMKLGVPWY